MLPDGDVREIFVVDGRITSNGVDDAETLLEDCVLLPGLVDVHAHLTMGSPSPPDATPEDSTRDSTVRAFGTSLARLTRALKPKPRS